VSARGLWFFWMKNEMGEAAKRQVKRENIVVAIPTKMTVVRLRRTRRVGKHESPQMRARPAKQD